MQHNPPVWDMQAVHDHLAGAGFEGAVLVRICSTPALFVQ